MQHDVSLVEITQQDHYEELVKYVDTLAQFFWLLLSDKTHGDYVMRTIVLPRLKEGDGAEEDEDEESAEEKPEKKKEKEDGRFKMERLAKALQWAALFEDRHGPFKPFLGRYDQFVSVKFEEFGDFVSLTPAGQKQVHSRDVAEGGWLAAAVFNSGDVLVVRKAVME